MLISLLATAVTSGAVGYWLGRRGEGLRRFLVDGFYWSDSFSSLLETSSQGEDTDRMASYGYGLPLSAMNKHPAEGC